MSRFTTATVVTTTMQDDRPAPAHTSLDVVLVVGHAAVRQHLDTGWEALPAHCARVALA